MLRLMLRIMTAFAVSLVLALWVVQNSTALQDAVGARIIQLVEKEWSAHVNSCKPRINFFTFSLYLEKGIVTPTDDKQFSWSFDACHVRVSPLALLVEHAAHLYITFNNITATTRATDSQIDLLAHIQSIFAPTSLDIAIEPKALTINNIDLTLTYNNRVLSCKAPGKFYIANDQDYMRFNEQTWHGSLEVEHAMLSLQDAVYAHQAKGRLNFYRNNRDGSWLFSSQLHTKLPVLDPAMDYAIEGSWDVKGGGVLLTDSQAKTRVATTFSYPWTIGVKGVFPANHIKTAVTLLASNTQNISPVDGTCAVDLVLLPDEQAIRSSGTVDFNAVKIGDLVFQHIGINLYPTADQLSANIALQQSAAYGMAGTLAWDWQKQHGSLTLTNTESLQPPGIAGAQGHYVIQPRGCCVRLTCDTDGLCKGVYDCSITSAMYDKTINHHGLLAIKNKKIAIKGRDDSGTYAAKASCDPHFYFTSVRYAAHDIPILACKASKQNPFLLKGSVSWQFVRKFLDQQTRRMIFGNKSSFKFALNQQNLQAIKADVALEHGSFYMPEYHNLLQACKASITVQPKEKRFEIDNCSIGMSKGVITCPHAVVQLDENNNIKHLMAPLCIDNLFVNWKKDFLGFVCGTLTLDQTDQEPAMLSGTLVLKKSLLRDAFLRGESPQNLYGSTGSLTPQLPFPLGFDVRLVTEKPIKANTGSFNAQANVDLRFVSAPQREFFAAPIVTGSIDLEKGALRILNQSLNIQYGKIQFIHNNFSDPLVDLVARNRIGKYLVTLQATGSLQKPTILLESMPALSEEQIISLLLTGAEQSTLQADLPAMLLQNLDVLVFSNRKETKGQVLMDTLTKTFKYVQITPNLDASKSGRGALRGSISVNVTDQLRAKIDKDLDTQSNFSAQIEYLLSDNLNLKLVQEQRGERGIELEFQVKI